MTDEERAIAQQRLQAIDGLTGLELIGREEIEQRAVAVGVVTLRRSIAGSSVTTPTAHSKRLCRRKEVGGQVIAAFPQRWKQSCPVLFGPSTSTTIAPLP